MRYRNRRHRVPSRRLGLLDAMIVILALAPAFVILRSRCELLGQQGSPNYLHTTGAFIAVCHAFLMALTAALTVIGLSGRGPRLRARLRRPGMAACIAATAAIVVMTSRMSIKTYSMMSHLDSFRVEDLCYQITDEQVRPGFAVVGAWFMLLVSAAWRPEASWLDRAGRLLGWLWIGMLIFHIALPWIGPFFPAY
jgi:hypothetical protein